MIAGHELVGTRIVGQLPADDMVRLWIKVSSGIVKHGFVIEYRDSGGFRDATHSRRRRGAIGSGLKSVDVRGETQLAGI
jgi:hypothetical protein